jgi:hypothetical protein
VIVGTRTYAEQQSGGIPLVPMAFALFQNYPNPFNPSTMIRYRLAGRSRVVLEVFDALGQRVRSLVNEEQVTGEYSVLWDGMNNDGSPAASGMYVCRLRARETVPGAGGGFVEARKLMLIR